MGDLLNELITERVLGYKVHHSQKRYDCESTGIGSYLSRFFPSEADMPKVHEKLIRNMYDQIKNPVNIWSTGFMNYQGSENEYSLRNNIEISAVRGELSKKRLEKILDKPLEIPTGDGGLLTSLLFDSVPEKKYSIGIIPHFREKDEPIFKNLEEHYKDSVIIDLTDDPLEVIQTISECEVIISSALHGLIVADSFGIPNKRLVYTDNMLGDGFKYDDYYSSFGLESNPFDLNQETELTINQIIDEYEVEFELVEKKMEQLTNAFGKV